MAILDRFRSRRAAPPTATFPTSTPPAASAIRAALTRAAAVPPSRHVAAEPGDGEEMPKKDPPTCTECGGEMVPDSDDPTTYTCPACPPASAEASDGDDQTEDDKDKEPDMATASTSPPGGAKTVATTAASISELKTAFPNDPAFALECAERGDSLLAAKAAYADVLQARIAGQGAAAKEAEQKAQAAAAGAARLGNAGTEGVPAIKGIGGGGGAGGGDFQSFEQAAMAYKRQFIADGQRPDVAEQSGYREAALRHPALHTAFREQQQQAAKDRGGGGGGVFFRRSTPAGPRHCRGPVPLREGIFHGTVSRKQRHENAAGRGGDLRLSACEVRRDQRGPRGGGRALGRDGDGLGG